MTSEADLREAYRRAGLWRHGVNYTRAIGNTATRRALAVLAKRIAEKRQPPEQEQLGLI